MNTHSLDLESGSTQYASIADASQTGLDLGTGPFTIEAWIKLESTGVYHTIAAKYEADDTDGYFFHVNNATNKLAMGCVAGATSDSLAGNTALSSGTWYHVTAVRDGTNLKIYLNGVDDSASAVTDNARQVSTAEPFHIGLTSVGYDATGRPLDGLIDEVRVWSVAKSEAQVQASMTTELVGNEANLVGYWKLNNNYLDETANNNDLTATGSPVFSTDVPTGFESPSASKSESKSASKSLSPSRSLSPSASLSGSASASISPSASASKSASKSASRSVSASVSASLSPSASASASLSPSASGSRSASASPSTGYSLYTRGDELTLPNGTSDLETIYSDDEETDVATRDDVRVGQTGALQYMIHQFKVFVGDKTTCKVEWEGRSDLAPSDSTVYLQIFNQTTTWETVDSNSSAPADTDFEMEEDIEDLTDYKDSNSVVTCRVYQLANISA